MNDNRSRRTTHIRKDADSGLFNTLADIGHKIFAPESYSCSLCVITHGYFQERDAWREFVASLPVACQFLHRDEFHRLHPESKDELPAVFIENQGELHPCISAAQLETCDNMETLKTMIIDSCIEDDEE